MSGLQQEIEKIFSPAGVLAKLGSYEYRKQQVDMAMSIVDGLENKHHNIIEAPTGVGKSFAYLVPSILFGLQEKRKAIVSTCTINLQEQLIGKDIPALHSVMGVDFKAEILKGRQNYICTKRLNKALIEKQSLFVDEEERQLQMIYNFVQKNGKGTRQEMPFAIDDNVWSEVLAEEGVCTSKSCGGADTNCFFQQAKNKVKDADVLVLNHYLFFTLFGYYERTSPGYLYADDFAIFDEAHEIDKIAAENVAPNVTREQIRFWLNKLFNPRKRKGFLEKFDASKLKQTVERLLQDTDFFFQQIESVVLNLYKKNTHKSMIRVREPLSVNNEFITSLLDLTIELKKLITRAKNDDEENEIKNYSTKFTRIRNIILAFVEQTHDDHVYWMEYTGRKGTNIGLNCSPIDLADYFRENVFTENRLSVMTSATLSVNHSLDFFKRAIGAEKIPSAILDSPFNFELQMKVYVDNTLPEPKKKLFEKVSDFFDEDEYAKQLQQKIIEMIHKTNGGALVLFTNYSMLKKNYDGLKEHLRKLDIRILSQSEKLSRNQLLDEFKNDRNSVLLGVDSFWMGVDVPGESLRNVIITKLPFDVPDHPVTEAKLEFIEEQGGNPFTDYSLPTAILKFRQGIGRLIRNKSDKGIVCILDRRVLTKVYGKQFLNSLPECEVEIMSNEY